MQTHFRNFAYVSIVSDAFNKRLVLIQLLILYRKVSRIDRIKAMLTILRYFWLRYVNSLFIYSKIKCKKYFPILFLMYLILSIHIYI